MSTATSPVPDPTTATSSQALKHALGIVGFESLDSVCSTVTTFSLGWLALPFWPCASTCRRQRLAIRFDFEHETGTNLEAL